MWYKETTNGHFQTIIRSYFYSTFKLKGLKEKNALFWQLPLAFSSITTTVTTLTSKRHASLSLFSVFTVRKPRHGHVFALRVSIYNCVIQSSPGAAKGKPSSLPPSSRCSQLGGGGESPPPPPSGTLFKGNKIHTYGREGMTGGMMPGWMEYSVFASSKGGHENICLFQK